ncbi:geranylgeranylglyceryl/heptaprenylglyceryl phosphate synthase [Sediminitomix flava]|uniref:Geranylgeranylglyceryl phosphate synthase n=1 Tax=Sediminitomix flava TaxID=379075 RepID=A0A315ZBF1_SEDFL|nr:geranylgeranylglyceryl/heptaprenylglyceryl phosphate synthase [Sediminitomix flava]PWJ42044.1 putative glycerol-1-phosphate prenyltransferase [Sediminitomix flava]
MNVLNKMYDACQLKRKQVAVLIDPDKIEVNKVSGLIKKAEEIGVSYIFIGGSLLLKNQVDAICIEIKKGSDIPVVLFPGNLSQLSPYTDATLFLSLVSGRNAEFLIGQHVVSAPLLKQMKQEVIPTAYVLIDGGRQTSVSYMSNTTPIPADKTDIAASTALAGEMLGMKMVYLEAGSGAQNPVTEKMISRVKQQLSVPLIVGGGIRSAKKATAAFEAGADIIVVGTAIENDVQFLEELKGVIASQNTLKLPNSSSLN